MGFASLLRNGVALIDSLTADLQANVQHWAFVSSNGRGGDTFNPPLGSPGTALPCIVDYRSKQHALTDGRIINVIATLTFPRPVAIDVRDRIVLPNGQTAPIQTSPGSVVDPTTGAGYFTEVMMGTIA